MCLRLCASPHLQVGVMAAVGPLFGISRMQSIRAGMLLAAGGEFAFVAFGAPLRDAHHTYLQQSSCKIEGCIDMWLPLKPCPAACETQLSWLDQPKLSFAVPNRRSDHAQHHVARAGVPSAPVLFSDASHKIIQKLRGVSCN